MENDFWNNPGLKNMSPEKLQFLMNFARLAGILTITELILMKR